MLPSSFDNSLLKIISSFLILFKGLSNKRFIMCVAGFSYLSFVFLQLIGILIRVFRRLIVIVSFSKLISALTFFSHFIPIKIFSSFDSITCNLIGNFLSWILKLSLTFSKAIMSFPFVEVKILLLGSSIGVFNFRNRVFVIILVDVPVSIITLTSWFLILNLSYKGVISYLLFSQSSSSSDSISVTSSDSGST